MLKIVDRKHNLELVIHTLIWIVFFISLVFLSPNHHHEEIDLIANCRNTFVFLFFYALVFYLNYFILIKEYIFSKKIFLFLIINLVLVVAVAWVVHELRPHFDPPPHEHSHHANKIERPFFNLGFFKMVPAFILPVTISVAIAITKRWLKTEAEQKEIERRNLESELAQLRYQLQPHFFFNSLNNIYSLIAITPEKAQEAIHNLSKLMRYLLYETAQEKISLAKELDFIKQYVNLMELRITDKTIVTVDFQEVTESLKVSPLLFLPLVENAYKHGISATMSAQIKFYLKIEEESIIFKTENSNFPKNDFDKSGSGIGLSNLKKRLDLLYAERYELKAEIINNVYIASLSIRF